MINFFPSLHHWKGCIEQISKMHILAHSGKYKWNTPGLNAGLNWVFNSIIMTEGGQCNWTEA